MRLMASTKPFGRYSAIFFAETIGPWLWRLQNKGTAARSNGMAAKQARGHRLEGAGGTVAVSVAAGSRAPPKKAAKPKDPSKAGPAIEAATWLSLFSTRSCFPPACVMVEARGKLLSLETNANRPELFLPSAPACNRPSNPTLSCSALPCGATARRREQRRMRGSRAI
eukprot:654284-Rhodomonas_salina.1